MSKISFSATLDDVEVQIRVYADTDLVATLNVAEARDLITQATAWVERAAAEESRRKNETRRHYFANFPRRR